MRFAERKVPELQRRAQARRICLVAQQSAALLLHQKVARHPAEYPFLEASVAIGTGDDDVGAFVLRNDDKSVRHADQGFGRD